MNDQTDASSMEGIAHATAESIADFFLSVTHPKRIIILDLLKKQSVEFSNLMEATEIRKTALSNHLNLLISKRLIERVSHGRYRITLNGESFVESVLSIYETSIVCQEEEKRKLYERFLSIRKLYEKLQIELVLLEPMTVASVSARGKSPENEAWKRMVSFAEPRGLFKDLTKHPVFGYNLLIAEDNSRATSPLDEEYEYVFLIRIDPDTELDGGVEIGQLKGGLFAVTRCTLAHPGGIQPSMVVGWQRLHEWLKSSDYKIGTSHVYLTKLVNPTETDEDLLVDLMMPIEKV